MSTETGDITLKDGTDAPLRAVLRRRTKEGATPTVAASCCGNLEHYKAVARDPFWEHGRAPDFHSRRSTSWKSIEEQARQAARLRELLSSRPATTSDRASAGVASLLDAFSREWDNEEERVQAICQLATKAKTVSWDKFEAFGIPPESRSAAWPNFPLQITVIDVDECRLATFDTYSDVNVSIAVLASCAIPGLFPPAPIKGHRYIDGGSWGSGDNAHLAASARSVLVISPLAAQHNRNAVILDRDVQSLRAQGARLGRRYALQFALNEVILDLADQAQQFLGRHWQIRR